MVAIDDQGLTELEQFRKSLPESDGKGHYWDSAIQGWRNNDGSLYDPQWQNKQVPNDPYFGNFDSGAAENLGSTQSQKPWQDKSGNVWNSDYQAWQDKSGNVWDAPSGAWIDPNAQLAWSQDNGWQTFDDYNQTQQNIYTAFQEQENIASMANANQYSLSTPALGQFNVANPDMNGDGLDDSTGFAVGVVRDSGSPSGYSYNGTPVTTNGAPWQGPTQGSLLGPNFPQNPVPQTPTGPFTAPSNPWTYNAALAGANPLGQPDALADSFRDVVRQPEPLGQGYKPDVRFPETPMLGNPLMGGLKLYDRVTNPIVETASQLTPAAITAAKYAPGIGGAVNLGLGVAGKLGLDYSPEENAVKGIKQLGGSLGEAVQNPANPLAFGEAQNEKFNERPTWQQIAGQVVYDPGNYVGGIGIAKKLGFIDDAGQFAPDAIKAGKTLKGLTGADEAIRTLGKADEFPAFAPDLARITKYPAGTIGIADNVAVPRLAGAADDAAGQLDPARRSLLDALDAERKFRTSGEADGIIRAGRATQAKGIGAAADNLGDSFAENVDALKGGARTGPMLSPTEGLKLDDATMNDLLKEAIDYNGGKQFDNLRAAKALDKLQQGQRLQPAEIKALGEIYGDEVARAIRETNPQRIATVAELTDADMAKIAEQSKVDGKRIAVLETQAKRQHELADDLVKQSRMDPTNPRLKKAVDDARARAIAKENEADRLLSEKARKLEVKQNEKAFTAEQKAAQKASNKAFRTDVSNDIATSGAKAIEKAEEIIDNLDVSPAMKKAQKDAIAIWVRDNGTVLDVLGDEAPGILRRAYAATTGEVTDSWTSALLSRQKALEAALREQGLSAEAARAVGKHVQDAEVARRFGDNIPAHVSQSLDQSRGIVRDAAGKVIDSPYKPGREASIIDSAATYSQEIKNTMFGIGDLAGIGQNVFHAGITTPVQFVTGFVNRIAEAMYRGIDVRAIDQDLIGRRVQYSLDGLSHSGSTGIVDASNGTLLRHIPGLRTADNRAIIPIINFLTDLQFKHILGYVRDVSYEGNLVLAKAVGSDITDPLVRARMAQRANVATGAGKLAQRANRANIEKATILSASMTRAQAQEIGIVGRALVGDRADRINAAVTILSTVGTTLAIGKLLNDWVGLDEFEFDPTEPGFGAITLSDGTVINLFSQTQVPRVMLRSIGVLQEDGFNESDLKEIGKLWGNFGMGRSSPALRLGEAAVGLGYEPGKGYRYGDLNEGKSLKDKLLSQAPIPPLITQTAREGFGKFTTPANVIGVNSFPENQYQTLDRKVKAALAFGGRGYSDLSPSEKQAAQEKYGKLDPFGPEGIRSQEVTTQLTTQQAESDTRRREGELTPEQWRKDYSDRKNERFIRNDEIYHATNFKPGKDTILNGYYAAIGQAERPDGTVDWDKVDAYRAGLDATANKHIDDNTGLVKIDTPVVRQFEADKRKIEDSGFFERTDANWNQIKDAIGLPDKTYEEWKDEQRKSLMDQLGITSEDVATAASVEKAIGKMPIEKAMDKLGSAWRDQWAIEHPEEAYAAMKYGYYSPKEKIRLWLASKFE